MLLFHWLRCAVTKGVIIVVHIDFCDTAEVGMWYL